MTVTYKEASHELRLKVKGDILSTNAEERAKAIGAALAENASATKLVIDLNAAKLIDSMGLNMLLGTVKTAREKQMQVTILIASTSVQRLFEFAHLGTLAEIRMREKRPRKSAS